MLEKYFIGLDISTSIVGISLLNKKKEMIKIDYIDLTKTKCIFEKASKFELFFSNFIQKNKATIEKIFIEDTLQSFARGLSSAKTLMQLSRFNGIVSNIVYRKLDIKPVYINVNKARKILGIKIDKNSDKDKKEQVLEWVNTDLCGYSWPQKVISRGKNKGRVKYENFCYDMSDAYVICKSGIILNENECKEKV